MKQTLTVASKKKTSYVRTIDRQQAERLKAILVPRGWSFDTAPYALWRASGEGASVIAYESGKLVTQGKGTEQFVRYILEPEILGEARFGYENELAEIENPQMFEPHIGIDESGKGDYFGPLVIAAVFVNGTIARELLDLGVTDSKLIKSDKRITEICESVKSAVNGRFSVVPIGPEAYNRLYAKVGNVNRLLGWGHARALENVLERAPDCPRAVSDQFAAKHTVINALLERGQDITLEQMPRAEADVAVAAASILARADFVRRLDKLSEEAGVKLPKGASPAVVAAGRELVAKHGAGCLSRFAKTHFKTTAKVTD